MGADEGRDDAREALPTASGRAPAEQRTGRQGGWGPGTVLRLLWRGGKVVAVIAAGGVELLVRRPRSRTEGALWVHRVCGRILRVLGIPVRVEGRFPTSGAVVVNHQGYIDIVVLAATRPCVFVSKAETATWAGIGWMIAAAGTVFVERGKGGSGEAAGVGMREAEAEGLPVVFFPEGTTSDGTEVLPFHGGLIAQARAAEQPVTAGMLRYSVAGPQGVRVEDDVAYWGEREMLPHMARFLTLKGVAAEVRFAIEPVRFTEEERKAAAEEARGAMLRLRAEERVAQG